MEKESFTYQKEREVNPPVEYRVLMVIRKNGMDILWLFNNPITSEQLKELLDLEEEVRPEGEYCGLFYRGVCFSPNDKQVKIEVIKAFCSSDTSFFSLPEPLDLTKVGKDLERNPIYQKIQKYSKDEAPPLIERFCRIERKMVEAGWKLTQEELYSGYPILI